MAGIDWINKNSSFITNALDNQETITENVDFIDRYKKVRIYPFRIVSGTQLLTKQGEVDILTNINKEGQYANFYTGNDQITIVWEGSTTLSANNPNQPNQIIETLQVGRYIDLLAADEGFLNKNNNLSTVNLYGIDYSTTETQNTLTLIADCSEDDYQTNKVWTFLSRNQDNDFIASSYVPTDYDIQNYVYLILDPRYQSYQWLRMKNVVYNYNQSTRKPLSALIEFETINNDFTNTGKSILQYFQHGTPNESYAFPVESYDEDGNAITELEKANIETVYNSFEGIDTIQLDYLGGYGLSSVGILGRRVSTSKFSETNGIYTRQIEPSQMLLLCDTLKIVESPFINRIPVQNVFAAYDMYNDVRGVYKSYQEAYGAQTAFGGYNVTATKEIITGMRPKDRDWSKVTGSNTLNQRGSATTSHIEGLEDLQVYDSAYYSNNTWFTDGMINDSWIKPIFQKDYVEGVPNFIAGSSGENISIPQFLNQNHIINWGVDELTTNYTQSTKYKVSSVLGVLGNIFTTLTGGLDIGWIRNKTLATGQTYNLLLPTEIYENAQATQNLNKDNALPLDYFNDQLAAKALPVNSNIYTAYRFSLTHLFTYEQSNVNTNRATYSKLGGGKDNIWDTKYLGQVYDENGELLLNDGSAFTPDIYKIVPYQTNEPYLIDWLQTKGIGICDRRVSMYRDIYNDFLETYTTKSVYQLIAQTTSKVKNNITLWTDSIKFNYYDEFNTFGHINYPVQHLPKSPILDSDKNRQLQVDAKKMWNLQKTWAEGVQGSKISDYSDILRLCYPTLNAKSDFDYSKNGGSRGWKQILGYYTDTPNDWLTKEKRFQRWFRISDLNNSWSNYYGGDPEGLSKWNQTYKINDIVVKYEQEEWAPENTLSNARTNLKELGLNIAIADTRKVNLGNENFKFTYTLKDSELQSFLSNNEINKDLTIEFNDVANSFAYPISIFGDYQIPVVGYVMDLFGAQRGWYVGNGSWYWLTNLNRIFNDSNLTYSLNDEHGFNRDYFSAYGNFDINIRSSINKIYLSWSTSNYNMLLRVPQYNSPEDYNITLPNSLLEQATGYDSQVRIMGNWSGGNYVTTTNATIKGTEYTFGLGTKALFVNYKPKCDSPSRKTTITLNLKAQIQGDNSLSISLSNINVKLDYQGIVRIDRAALWMGSNPGEYYDKNNKEYSGNSSFMEWGLSYSRTPASYFQKAGNSKELKAGAFFFNYTNFGDNLGLWRVPKSSDDSHGINYTSAISPIFYWDRLTYQKYEQWLQRSAKESGNKTGNTNLFKETWDIVNGGNDWITKDNEKWTFNMKYPMTAGGMRSGQRFWMLEEDGSSVMSYGLKFQYDPDVNFQPLLAFSFSPKWKN